MKDEDKPKVDFFEKLEELIRVIEKDINELERYKKISNEYQHLLINAKDKLREAKLKHENRDENDLLNIYLLLFYSGRLIYFLKGVTSDQINIYS